MTSRDISWGTQLQKVFRPPPLFLREKSNVKHDPTGGVQRDSLVKWKSKKFTEHLPRYGLLLIRVSWRRLVWFCVIFLFVCQYILPLTVQSLSGLCPVYGFCQPGGFNTRLSMNIRTDMFCAYSDTTKAAMFTTKKTTTASKTFQIKFGNGTRQDKTIGRTRTTTSKYFSYKFDSPYGPVIIIPVVTVRINSPDFAEDKVERVHLRQMGERSSKSKEIHASLTLIFQPGISQEC